jgi:hypothetical protein
MDPYWAATSAIYFRSHAGPMQFQPPDQKNAPGLALAVTPRTGGYRFIFHDGIGPTAGVEIAGGFWNGHPVPFTITLTSSGLFTVDAGGVVKSQQLGEFKVANVDFICSTSAVTFSIVAASDP